MLDRRKRKVGIVGGASIVALWFLCRFFVQEEVVSDLQGGGHGHVKYKNTSLVAIDWEEKSNVSTNVPTIREEGKGQSLLENNNKSNGIGSFHVPGPNPSATTEPIATTTTTTDPLTVPLPVTSTPDPTSAPSIISQYPFAPEDSFRMKVRENQLESYRNGSGLILNVHVTHHGGTAVCGVLRSADDVPTLDGYQSEVPEFACMGDAANISGGVYQYTKSNVPWIGQNETANGISKARRVSLQTSVFVCRKIIDIVPFPTHIHIRMFLFSVFPYNSMGVRCRSEKRSKSHGLGKRSFDFCLCHSASH